MKKVFKIEADCPNCANKMEDAVKKIDGIVDATVNFMTQKLTVEFADGVDTEAVMKSAKSACKKIDRDLEIFL